MQSTIDPRLGISPHGTPAQFHLADHAVIQGLWRSLQAEAAREEVSNLTRDASENGLLALGGRFLPPKLGKPIYWAVRDNRVHFSFPLDALGAQDRMLLVNQVLVAFAQRSQKDDLKSAALAVSESGHCYIGMNTQERPTMDWEKECAESNVARLFKQLSASGERIAHMYVLGGLTDGQGKMHVADHLVGMCMRCVEIVASLMAPGASVTVIPANDSKASIALRQTHTMRDVLPNEAWEVPYRLLKEPSVIRFSEAVNQRQAEAYAALRDNPAGLDVGAEEAAMQRNGTLENINRFMVAKLVKVAQEAGPGPLPSHMSIAVVEITDGATKRYAYGMENKGTHNAMLSPVSNAVNHSHVPIPRGPDAPYISRTFVMGYNADGSPLDYSTEQWDRLYKRVGEHHVKESEVNFLPLNTGDLDRAAVQTETLDKFTPTAFLGSKQHAFHSHCRG